MSVAGNPTFSERLRRQLYKGVFHDDPSTPYYLADLPSRRRKLADVKRGMFHPCPPSFRKMEMHDMQHRLPEDHCRCSTELTLEEFAKAENSGAALPPPGKPLSSLAVTETGRVFTKQFASPEDVIKANTIWHKAIEENDFDKEKFKQTRDKLHNDTKDLNMEWKFDGMALVQKRKEVRDWRFRFQQEPRLTRIKVKTAAGPRIVTAPQPTPALSDARHRPAGLRAGLGKLLPPLCGQDCPEGPGAPVYSSQWRGECSELIKN